MKYVGIWWGMHINTMTWSSGPKHGATTENTKRYIDFAAANGFGGVLVEGWNIGWDGDWIANRDAFSFTQAYPDYDLPTSRRTRRQKGVRLIVHNETSGGIQNYERQLDSAFTLYRSLGPRCHQDRLRDRQDQRGPLPLLAVHGAALPQGDRDGGASTGSCWTSHEPMHDTGERRTCPEHDEP